MKSSYNSNLNFGDIFSVITKLKKPKKIVEFGILEGFSLQHFINNSTNCTIEAYDIFEDFIGNGACYDEIIKNFEKYPNVIIKKRDFYEKIEDFEDNSIDILHIDIANDGDVYDFVFKYYIKKIKKDGIIILEGGSIERDNVEWMIKYKKNKIIPVLQKYSKEYDIFTINKFPSLTIVQHK